MTCSKLGVAHSCYSKENIPVILFQRGESKPNTAHLLQYSEPKCLDMEPRKIGVPAVSDHRYVLCNVINLYMISLL